MVRIGLVIAVGAIIASIGIAWHPFLNIKQMLRRRLQERLKAGPVEYTVTFDGIFEGGKDTKLEHMFVKIRIC